MPKKTQKPEENHVYLSERMFLSASVSPNTSNPLESVFAEVGHTWHGEHVQARFRISNGFGEISLELDECDALEKLDALAGVIARTRAALACALAVRESAVADRERRLGLEGEDES